MEALTVNEGADACREVERLKPDLILLDPVLLGDECLALIAALRQRAAQSALFVVTAANASVVSQCFAAGACGAIAKPVVFEELLLVVGAALHRKLMREEEPPSERRPPGESLSERDLRIAECVARGLTNKEIGKEIHLSEKRVQGLLTRILREVRVKRREGLARWYKGRKAAEN